MLRMNKQMNSSVECGLTKGATMSSTSSKRSNLSSIVDQGGAIMSTKRSKEFEC
jgi:hypothetical protein